MFVVALNSMLSLFICMLVGYFGVKSNLLKEEMIPTLNKFIINVTFPAMMINVLNIELTQNIVKIAPGALFMGLVYEIILWLMVLLLIKIFKVKKHKRSIIIFSFMFTNVGFIGFPLIGSVYGQEGLLYLSMFNIMFNIIVFTLGLYILQEDSTTKLSIKKILTTPVMIAIWIGLFLLFSQLVFPYTFTSEVLGTTRLPYFLSSSIKMIGDITGPLAMIVVGASLIKTDIKKVFLDYRLHVFSFFKLLVAPIIVYLLFRNLINDDILLTITIVLSGLPTATISVILAEEFGLDYVFTSEIVFITTLYSVVITPFLFLL